MRIYPLAFINITNVKGVLIMPRKLTHEEFINKILLIHEQKFTFLNEYGGSQCKIHVHCNICKTDFYSTPNILLSGKGCKKCSDNKITKSKYEFIQEMNKIYGDKFTLISDYTRMVDNITVMCNIHKKSKTLRARTFLRGNTGCELCKMKNGRKHNIDLDYFISKIKSKNKFKDYNFDKFNYINVRTPSIAICEKGHEFNITPTSLNSGRGCPECALHTSTSKAMYDIIEILTKNNISFEREKKFPECYNKQKLPFDIYLNDYNILIEYDGKQHYEIFEHWGGEKEFINRQINDNIKTQFCIDNNIQFIRIRYDENHVEILNNLVRNIK